MYVLKDKDNYLFLNYRLRRRNSSTSSSFTLLALHTPYARASSQEQSDDTNR
jgi:hypothetical protein